MAPEWPADGSDRDAPAPGGRAKPVLREVAYRRFMERVFRGDLRPGRLMSQRELCELTGSPISPMREALKRLEAEGIIKLIPQRGVLLREVSPRELEEAYEMRCILELHAVRAYASHCRLSEVRAIRHATEAAIELQAENSRDAAAAYRARMEADEMLHSAIIRSLDNQLLASVFEKLLKTMRLVRLDVLPRFASQAPALQEHLQIIEALEARDPDAAADALRLHLDQARRRALGLE